jgi:hypothetical protein
VHYQKNGSSSKNLRNHQSRPNLLKNIIKRKIMSNIEELLKKDELFTKVLRRPTDYIRVGNYLLKMRP